MKDQTELDEEITQVTPGEAMKDQAELDKEITQVTPGEAREGGVSGGVHYS